MKVYIVTYYDYDDFEIDDVFLTKELAQRHINSLHPSVRRYYNIIERNLIQENYENIFR